MPRAVLFGPTEYGGIGLPDLYCDQGYLQLRLLIGHLNLQNDLSRLIPILISNVQLFLGSATPFFALPASDYLPWAPANWITSIWSFTSALKICPEIFQHWCPPLPRANDHPIMDLALSYQLAIPIIQSINRCRIHLKVFFLSDVVSSDRLTILPKVLNGLPPIDRESQLEWMTQLSPCHKDWNHWSTFFQYFTRNGKLRNPLGRWVNPTHQSWQWFCDPASNNIHHVDPITNSCRLYSPARTGYNTRNRGMTYSVSQAGIRPDTILLPVTRILLGPTASFTCAKSSSALVIHKHLQKPSQFHPPGSLLLVKYSTTPPPFIDSFLERLSQYHTNAIEFPMLFFPRTLWSALTDPKELMADVLSTSNGETLWLGCGPTDGHPQLTSAFSSELSGILAVLYIIHRICQYYHITKGSPKVFCDNKAALHHVCHNCQQSVSLSSFRL